MASLGRNIVANYVGRTWAAILGILLVPVYLRFMGIEAYGLVGFYMALSSVLGILDLGIGATMNRELARLSAKEESAAAQRDVVRTLELIYWGIAIFAGGVVVLLAPYITKSWIRAQTLDSGSILKAVQLMGIAVALQFPMSFYQGGLMGLQRQVLVNGILMVIGTLRSVGAILVLWLASPTIEAFLAWQVFASIIGSGAFLVAMWLSLPRHAERARFRGHILYGVWKYAAAISANAIIGIVLTQLDKIILSRMLTLKMFGYYSLAATVASAIWMIIIPFNTAIFPRFVQLHELKRTQELMVLFHRSAQILSTLLLPVCALLVIFSREILFLWMHDPSVVENCYLIVSFLVFGTMLNGIASVPGYSASAFGWPQLITYTNAIQAVVMIPLIVSLVFWLRGVGAAIAWVILNSTYVIFMVPIYFRRYLREEQGQWYFRDVGAPAFAAFAICMVAQLIAPAFHTRLAIAGWLTVTGIIATVATALTLPHVRGLVCSRFPPRLFRWVNAA
jgi:O-antigen/teichoic acid export membrane protein